ncbi:MAG TPA: hypothetical protein VFL63_04980 [Rhodanobacteraceae bacterium]|nr:hypothetical protein [Rhodanobacteraceae bacterium]
MTHKERRGVRWSQYFLGIGIAVVGFLVIAFVKSYEFIQLAGLGVVGVGLYVMRRSHAHLRAATKTLDRSDAKPASQADGDRQRRVVAFSSFVVAVLALIISAVAVVAFDGSELTIIANVLSIILIAFVCARSDVRETLAVFINGYWIYVSVIARVLFVFIMLCGIVSIVSVSLIVFGNQYVYTNLWVPIIFLCSFCVVSLACVCVIARWAIRVASKRQ